MTNEASRRNEGALQCSGLLNLDTLHNFGWKVMGGILLHTCEQSGNIWLYMVVVKGPIHCNLPINLPTYSE